MQSTFGSLYVNDFTLFGRTYRVSLSSEGEFRTSPDDLRHVFVRSQNNTMVPLNAVVSVSRIVGPDIVERFNIFPAAKVMGNPAPGFSSGQAIAAMQQVAAETLGSDYTIGWTGAAYQEIATAGTGNLGFIFGLVMVFLILAAQYERWSLPMAVLTAVPFAVFGAILAIYLRGIDNDVYFQIGLVTLIGLAAKNAILIVEFASQRHREGLSVVRCGDGCGAPAFPADRHDVARVHSRRVAARDQHRRGLGEPTFDRDRRDRRHARRHPARDPVRAAVLPADDQGTPGSAAEQPRPRADGERRRELDDDAAGAGRARPGQSVLR